MSNTESELYQILRRHLPMLDMCRIETDMGDGVPDVNHVHGWTELKTTNGWKVQLRPAQIGWISRRVRRGGRVTVVVRQQGSGRDSLWVVPGSLVRELAEGGLHRMETDLSVTQQDGCPDEWDWGAIRDALAAG